MLSRLAEGVWGTGKKDLLNLTKRRSMCQLSKSILYLVEIYSCMSFLLFVDNLFHATYFSFLIEMHHCIICNKHKKVGENRNYK